MTKYNLKEKGSRLVDNQYTTKVEQNVAQVFEHIAAKWSRPSIRLYALFTGHCSGVHCCAIDAHLLALSLSGSLWRLSWRNYCSSFVRIRERDKQTDSSLSFSLQDGKVGQDGHDDCVFVVEKKWKSDVSVYAATNQHIGPHPSTPQLTIYVYDHCIARSRMLRCFLH